MFLTLYLQLLGMSDAAASALMALFLGGSALGGLVGGWLGDKAAQVTLQYNSVLKCMAHIGQFLLRAYLMLLWKSGICLTIDNCAPGVAQTWPHHRVPGQCVCRRAILSIALQGQHPQ